MVLNALPVKLSPFLFCPNDPEKSNDLGYLPQTV